MITPEDVKKWQDATGHSYPTKEMIDRENEILKPLQEIETWEIGLNFNIEIALGNLIARQFPQYTHMITLDVRDNKVYIGFLDPDCDYTIEVVSFLTEQIRLFTLPLTDKTT